MQFKSQGMCQICAPHNNQIAYLKSLNNKT